MLDYFLKFSTEEVALAQLKEAGYTSVNEEGKEFVISATHSYCIDLVGDIYEGGIWETTDEGEIITIEEPTKIDGYHVNIRILSEDISENLQPYIIDTPATPYRIFG